MPRSPLLSSAGAVALAVAVTAPQEGAARVFDVVSTFPKGLTYLGEGAENFAQELERVSDGELQLRVHGAGDIVPAFEVFDAVSSGAVEAGWDWVGYWAGTIPAANIIGAMPFGPSPEVFLSWMWDADGMDILQRAYDPFNVKVLPCHLTAPEAGGWFNTEINSPEDLQGLRFRISGLGGEVMNRLGASTSLIPGGELYLAMERGRIDGAEFSLPNIDQTLGLHEFTRYYYFPGWHQPASWNSFIINMDVWNGLSEHEQNMFWTACKANVLWSMKVAAAPQTDVLETFEEAGVEVRRFPDEVLAALRETTQQVLEEEAERDPLFKEAYESITAHMEQVSRWYELQQLPRD